MNKDEMKSRISMALIDPILQQGFEIICKENYDLKHKMASLERYVHLVEVKADELRMRNAELAGQKASLERWLGEAKAIIRNIIRVTWGESWNYSLGVQSYAEQFLTEVEK